jgi:hypothetical protein
MGREAREWVETTVLVVRDAASNTINLVLATPLIGFVDTFEQLQVFTREATTTRHGTLKGERET